MRMKCYTGHANNHRRQIVYNVWVACVMTYSVDVSYVRVRQQV